MSSTTRTPLWLWPNVLSLDAPCIAALWQNLFANVTDAPVSLAARLALPLAVWLIYLIDRLLDTSRESPRAATARHRFCRDHRKFSYLLAACATLASAIVVRFLPLELTAAGLAVSALVAFYLFLVHRLRARALPKEALVSVIFAIGTALAPLSRTSSAWRLLFPALLFSLLCWINCSAIEAWESGASRWAARHMKALACCIAFSCLPLSLFLPRRSHCALALFVAAAGLWQIARAHLRVEKEALRVWADVPLLAPLLLVVFH